MFRSAFAGIALFIAALPAHGASFLIDFSINGSQNFTGSFKAPSIGGNVSAFTANIDGVIFDVQDGGGLPVYDPLVNDFQASISFTNSNVTGLCPVGACDLTLFPDPSPIPGDYQAVGPGPGFVNFDDGTKYEISPAAIPLPASAVLLLAALGTTAVIGRRRRGSA